MVSTKYANAITEVLHYLKGIREEDVNKIPKKIMNFFEENASKEYICDFDYTKPLKDLNITDEAKGIITYICYSYWCETEENKTVLLKKLNENTRIFQQELKEKYPNDVFKTIRPNKEGILTSELKTKKELKIITICKKILSCIKRKK